MAIDDLSEQLSLTQKINSVIERMTFNLTKLEQSYVTQNQYLEKMVETLKAFDVSKASTEVNNLTQKIKNLNTMLEGVGSTSEQSINNLIKNAGKATNKSKVLNEILKNNASSLKDVGNKSSVFNEIAKAVANAGVSADGFGGKIKNLSEFFKGKFPKMLLVATGALSGLVQGFENVWAISKSVVGVLSTVGKGLFNVGLAILSIPMKIFTGLVDMAASASAGFAEFRQALEDVRKEFGDLKGPTSLALTGLMQDFKGFADTGLSTWRVFGNFAERLQYLKEVATSMGAAFDATREEWVENGGALLGFQKGLGLTAEQLKSIASRAISTGKPMSKFLLDTAKQTLSLGKAFGISQKVIGKDMAKAFDDMKHFAQLSVKEIGTASVYARKLGVELDKITGTLDQFETFDSAAESAAKLTQSFGLTVDAFQLMEAQSPAEQIDMLRKSFTRAGVDVTTFNRQQLKLLSSTTGLDEATAKQVFSMHNQGASLDDIKKKSEVAEKKQLTQADAMGKLADSIERLVKQQDQTGSFFDMFMKGVGQGLQSSKDFIGIIHNIKNGLQAVFEVGVSLGRQLPAIMPGLGKFFSGIREFFSPEKYRAIAQSVSNAVKDYFTGKKTLPAALAGMKDQFMTYFSAQGPVAMKIFDGFKGIVKGIGKLINDSIPFIAKSIAGMLTKLVDFIKNPKQFLKNATSGASSQFGFLSDIVLQTAMSLKDAGSVIWPPMKELLIVLFNKAVDFIKSPEVTALAKKIAPYIALVFFGPVVVQAALGAATAFLVTSTLQAFASSKVIENGKKAALGYLGRIFGGAGSSAAAGAVSNAVDAGLSTASTKAGGLFARIASIPLVASAITMGKTFAAKVGASGIGSAMGAAVGLAAVAYIGIKGKQIIDDAFAKGKSADKSMFSADMSGNNALRSKSLEKKLEAIKNLQDTIKEQQTKLADKGFGEKMINFVAGTDIAADQAANSLATARRTLADLQKQVEDLKKTGLNTDSLKPPASSTALVDNFISPVTLDDAKSKLADLESLGKKLKGKDFNVQKLVDDIKGKFEGVSFEFLTPEKASQLTKSMESFQGVTNNVLESTKSLNVFKGFAQELNSTIKEIKAFGMAPALKAINEMVDQVRKMDEALSDGKLNTVNVQTKLKSVASGMGLGGKASYTIQSKPVNITVNLNVSMNAEDMEKALIMRSTSIIRERLNFVTSSPSDRGDNLIGDKPGDQPSLNRTSGG